MPPKDNKSPGKPTKATFVIQKSFQKVSGKVRELHLLKIESGPQPVNETDKNHEKLAEFTAKFMRNYLECYNMNHRTRGRCIIIAHEKFAEERELSNFPATGHDVKSIADCFRDVLGFKDISIYSDDSERDDFYDRTRYTLVKKVRKAIF